MRCLIDSNEPIAPKTPLFSGYFQGLSLALCYPRQEDGRDYNISPPFSTGGSTGIQQGVKRESTGYSISLQGRARHGKPRTSKRSGHGPLTPKMAEGSRQFHTRRNYGGAVVSWHNIPLLPSRYRVVALYFPCTPRQL